MSKTYITTAIPYVNGDPHIGHALDYLLADSFARYRTLQGDIVRFQAGVDEHGNKVYQKAQTNHLPVERYVAQNTKKFQNFIEALGVQYSDFIRTTDPDHQRRCQAIWQKLQDHIYLGTYQGWYCDGCEAFITQKEYDSDAGVCPDHQKPYQQLTEQNYYLRIADFKDQIQQAISSDQLQILPAFRKKEVLTLLQDTPDISISRPQKQLSWGVPVPGDDSQVMYVWVDALVNYITVLGYPDQDITDFWPATVQFVGKDILRFHAIIWPAILLGLGLPLPRIIHSHGHVLINGHKMSKSLGNVVDPIAAIKRHGLPAFRYFFLRHIDTFTDSDFTWEKFDAAYNNELANDLGNLVQRLATLVAKNHISTPAFTASPDQTYQQFMEQLQFSSALGYIWQQIQELNKQIDQQKPWALAKAGKRTELRNCLHALVCQLLQISHLLQPFLPTTAQQITDVFTAPHITPPATPLFPKL